MIHILISACLIGENCKWDGTNNRNQGVLEFMKKMEGKAEFHPVCPEQLAVFRLRVRLPRSICRMRR